MKFNQKDITVNENMLSTQRLNIGYLNPKSIIASNINLNLQQGQLYCLIGPNGSGKTTLLRTLSGFLKPLDGHIFMSGKDLSQFSTSKLSTHISIVLTKQPALPLLTVFDVVAMGRHPFTDFWGHITASDKAIVLNALRMVNIENKISCFFDHLSDGEKQKVMIAKALAQQTPFIFLDEPAAFLDFPSRIEIMQLLSELAHHQNKTILLSTHDVPLAFQYADEIILMALGKPTISAKPSEIIFKNLLEDYFALNGKKYNPFSLLNYFEPSFKKPVFVDGNEESYASIRTFLEQRGFIFVEKPEESQFIIKVDKSGEIRFYFRQQLVNFKHIEEFDIFLKNVQE
jgi:iron complex transport system ATP-binding protein